LKGARFGVLRMVLVNTKVSEMPHCGYRSLVTDVTKEHIAIIRVR